MATEVSVESIKADSGMLVIAYSQVPVTKSSSTLNLSLPPSLHSISHTLKQRWTL